MEYIEDVLTSNLRIVFCGMAPGNVSARERAYYAHKGNRFWNLLYEIGATDRILAPADFRELLTYQIGITDLFKDQSGMDKVIDKGQFNRPVFEQLIKKYAPEKLAFTSKNVGEVYFGVKGKHLRFGLQNDQIGTTKLFILPGTSPANNSNWIKNSDAYIKSWKDFFEY